MRDPLVGFAWETLYKRYDAMCSRFQPHSPHLDRFGVYAGSDRALYQHLCSRFQSCEDLPGIGDYEAMLYWKLYSNPQALGNLRAFLCGDQKQRMDVAGRFAALVAAMPSDIEHDVDEIVDLIEWIGSFHLLGMKSATALPMRTTFLHFRYPTEVPILDKMVLQAVGVREEDANHDIGVLREYIPFAWELAERHAPKLDGFSETRVRLTDMALWIARGKERHRTGCMA